MPTNDVVAFSYITSRYFRFPTNEPDVCLWKCRDFFPFQGQQLQHKGPLTTGSKINTFNAPNATDEQTDGFRAATLHMHTQILKESRMYFW